MKRNDIKALHSLSVAELNEKVKQLTSEVTKARMEKKVGKLTNRRLGAMLSDDLARVKTILTLKEMETV